MKLTVRSAVIQSRSLFHLLHRVAKNPVRFQIIAMSTSTVKPQTMKISSPVFDELFTPELRAAKELFERNGMDVRMAGGAVRDLLLGIKPEDIDFSTTSSPEEMMDIFQKEGIRLMNYGKRALDHGTITIRINDKVTLKINGMRKSQDQKWWSNSGNALTNGKRK